MDFLPLELPSTSAARNPVLKAIKPMEIVTSTKTEITASQFYEMVAQRKTKARYAALDRVVQEAIRKFARSMDETEAVSNEMEEIQSKRRQRSRLQQAIRSGTATKEDRQLYEKSTDLEEDYDELLAKETKASSESEKSWERLERSKSKLREFSLETFFSHCYEVRLFAFHKKLINFSLKGRRALLQGRRHRCFSGSTGERGHSSRRSSMDSVLAKRR
jgi:hypothetical protein